MRLKLPTGHELLIQGPATARIISGDVSSLAKPLLIGEPLIVRAGRLRIIEAFEESEFDLIVGQNGRIDEVEKSTIPYDWTTLANKLKNEESADVRIMVLGGLDTGKNTLTTYIGNMLLRAGFKIAIMDADVGQSEIGPPTTMSIALIENPIFELLEAKPNSMFFVGSTSPAYVISRVLKGTEQLVNTFTKAHGEVILFINMPGWISGQGAIRFLLQMVSATKASLLLALQRENEAEDLLQHVASKIQSVRLTVSPYARLRTKEERKFLRETSYRKYFANSEDIVVRYGEIDFSPLFSSNGQEASMRVTKEVEDTLRNRVLYCEEGNISINAIVMGQLDAGFDRPDETASVANDDETEYESGSEHHDRKKIRVIPITELNGLIVALLDKNEQMISLGILKNLDLRAKRATVSTPSRPSDVSRIEVGKLKIKKEGYEIGYAEIMAVASIHDQQRSETRE